MQAVNGSSITGTFQITPATVFTGYTNFTSLITNLWNEYRITRIRVRFIPTAGAYAAAVFIPALFVVSQRGAVLPPTTVAGITAYPYSKRFTYGTKELTVVWEAPTDDPEAMLFNSTSAAHPVTGSLTAAWNSGPVTATITYLTIVTEYVLTLRGAKL